MNMLERDVGSKGQTESFGENKKKHIILNDILNEVFPFNINCLKHYFSITFEVVGWHS